jgi:alkanesulfonate monooxygenase SsuD/methylene tetrahydromethanopterin reductase-like flavin-dependent oxidoreductase (luciferase family)
MMMPPARGPVTTAVTCPTTRVHPAVIAQAAATASLLTEGRFTLGVGTGEALNEHVTGAAWPPAAERQEMLEEAVTIIAELLTGEQLTHHGPHYEVHTARLYSVPEVPPPVYVTGFGEQSARLAARIGDGFVCVSPQADLVKTYRDEGGGDRRAGTRAVRHRHQGIRAGRVRRGVPLPGRRTTRRGLRVLRQPGPPPRTERLTGLKVLSCALRVTTGCAYVRVARPGLRLPRPWDGPVRTVRRD